MAKYEINEDTIAVLEMLRGTFSLLRVMLPRIKFTPIIDHLTAVIALIRTDLQALRKRQQGQEVGEDGQPKVDPL